MRADRGMLRANRRCDRQRVGDVFVDGEALPGEGDRRSNEIGEGEFSGAVFAPGELEPGDRAGNADGEAGKAGLERIGFSVGVEKDVFGGRSGRSLAIVDGDGLPEIGAVDQHEAAAADIAGARQGHGEREADRHRRVDRIAAALQNVEADG